MTTRFSGFVTVSGMTTDEERQDLLAWLRANGADPDQIPEFSKATLAGDQLTVEYLVRDADGAPRSTGMGLLTRPRTFTVTSSLTDFAADRRRAERGEGA